MLGLRVYLFGLCVRPLSRPAEPAWSLRSAPDKLSQLMLTASAIYNVIGCGMKHHTQFLRRIDHGCIYVMIAGALLAAGALAGTHPDSRVPAAPGSYTPLMLHLPAGAISSRIDNDTVLKGIWAVALTGSALKIILARRFETAGLLLYVCLGCTVISFTHAVTEGFPGGGALLMEFVKSGACYLFGLIFYLGDEIPFSNALWHSCVLAGAATHWVIVHHLIALGEVGYPH